MTIQVAAMNAHGLAMASDRHVYRRGDARSTGRDGKLFPGRGDVPLATMHAGRHSVLGVPAARLSMRVARAIEEAGRSGAEALGEAALRALAGPVSEARARDASVDADVLREAARDVARRALETDGGMDAVIAEAAAARPFLDGDPDEARRAAAEAWASDSGRALAALSDPAHAALLERSPAAAAAAVALALSRAWRPEPHASFMAGACCTASGVPVLVAVDAWAGLGNRLLLRSRVEGRFAASWGLGNTALLAQGSGRAAVNSMLDGIDDENWGALSEGPNDEQRRVVSDRWERAHDSLRVSSAAELASVASGIVRAAEVIGFLVGRDEGSVDVVDCVLLTPTGVQAHALGAPCRPVQARRKAA